MLAKINGTQSQPAIRLESGLSPSRMRPVISQAVVFKLRKRDFADEVRRNNECLKKNLARISAKSQRRYLGEFVGSVKEPNWAQKLCLWSQKKNEIRSRELQKENLQILNHLARVKPRVL